MSGASGAVEYKPFPTLGLILIKCTCLPSEAGFGADCASGFGIGLGFLFLATKLSSTHVAKSLCFVSPNRRGYFFENA